MAVISLPSMAQIFNFSLRTNNQQLIDEALSGAFIRINQSYELCDTIKNEHFGREGKDYFSIVPFIGIETERGLIFPSSTLQPWNSDNDFDEYKNQYKPILTETKLNLLNNRTELIPRDLKSLISGLELTRHLTILSDSTQIHEGLKVDTIPGTKNGWLIWLSSNAYLVVLKC